MITAVDTSVLLDVFTADITFGERSREALQQCRRDGRLIACDVVWAEIAAAFDDVAQAVAALEKLGMAFDAVGRTASLRAGDAWRSYRLRGGERRRVIPDFLVGAHAIEAADRLLTRDHGFHRDYFDELVVVDPTVPR